MTYVRVRHERAFWIMALATGVEFALWDYGTGHLRFRSGATALAAIRNAAALFGRARWTP